MKLIDRITWLQWLALGALLLIFSGASGLTLGYAAGAKDREKQLTIAMAVDTQVQFDLGVKDFEAENYDLAKQRFVYVVQQDPSFPGAVDMLAESLVRLAESETQNANTTLDPSPTPTPAPTPDTRPVEELFASAEQQRANQDWKNLVQTIIALRNIDPHYRSSELDRLLFLGLRFSGIEKILDDGDLEGGVYDLALVERFAPLDLQASIYQDWARLYQLGVSFWGIFPDQSVYYFSQLASAAPYLRDFSGIFAKDRYRTALLQYGDQLAKSGDWCSAMDQYGLAQSQLDDQVIQPTITFAQEQCLYGNATPTSPPVQVILSTAIPTETPTPSATSESALTPPPAENTPEPTQTIIVAEPTTGP